MGWIWWVIHAEHWPGGPRETFIATVHTTSLGWFFWVRKIFLGNPFSQHKLSALSAKAIFNSRGIKFRWSSLYGESGSTSSSGKLEISVLLSKEKNELAQLAQSLQYLGTKILSQGLVHYHSQFWCSISICWVNWNSHKVPKLLFIV